MMFRRVVLFYGGNCDLFSQTVDWLLGLLWISSFFFLFPPFLLSFSPSPFMPHWVTIFTERRSYIQLSVCLLQLVCWTVWLADCILVCLSPCQSPGLRLSVPSLEKDQRRWDISKHMSDKKKERGRKKREEKYQFYFSFICFPSSRHIKWVSLCLTGTRGSLFFFFTRIRLKCLYAK